MRKLPGMTISALVIQTDGGHEVVDIEPTLEAFKEAVGGWLEPVSSGEDWLAYVDEEGRIKQLPINTRATALARHLGWPGDFLVGPVVFVGQERRGEDGAVEVSVPPRIVEAVVH